MSNKVLIKLYVPTLGESYDLFIPVNEIMWKVNRLIVKMISDSTEGVFNLDKDYAMINVDTGRVYDNNDIIINTDIRNATKILLVEI